jgi:hypothetical protein
LRHPVAVRAQLRHHVLSSEGDDITGGEIRAGATNLRWRRLRLAVHLAGHLAELDINPLMVLPAGHGVKAVDALAILPST